MAAPASSGPPPPWRAPNFLRSSGRASARASAAGQCSRPVSRRGPVQGRSIIFYAQQPRPAVVLALSGSQQLLLSLTSSLPSPPLPLPSTALRFARQPSSSFSNLFLVPRRAAFNLHCVGPSAFLYLRSSLDDSATTHASGHPTALSNCWNLIRYPPSNIKNTH